jgi:hypothetical protein
VESLGHLDPAGVSAALLRAEFGLTDEGLPGCTKSGVFAAYAAHGLPILSSDNGRSAEDPVASLTHAEEFLINPSLNIEQIRDRAKRLRRWYAEYADWPNLARALQPVLSANLNRTARAARL